MRVVLSGYDSRGGVEPLVGLAVRLRALGSEVRVCTPPDEEFAERLAGVGVPMVPVGQSVRALVTGATPAADLPRRAAELVAAQFDKVAAAAEAPGVPRRRTRRWAPAPAAKTILRVNRGFS